MRCGGVKEFLQGEGYAPLQNNKVFELSILNPFSPFRFRWVKAPARRILVEGRTPFFHRSFHILLRKSVSRVYPKCSFAMFDRLVIFSEKRVSMIKSGSSQLVNS
jgi:hypothetical protein